MIYNSNKICDCGVIGSRKGLKIPRFIRTGSSPVSRTKE